MIRVVEVGLDGGEVDIICMFLGVVKKIENFVVLIKDGGYGRDTWW